MGWFVDWLAQSKRCTAHRCMLHPEVDYFINFFFSQLLLLVFTSALQGKGLRSLCFVRRCLAVRQAICSLRLYTGRQRCKPRRGTGGEAWWSESINQGDSGRCHSNWLPASWTQYIMHLGWGWHFNGLISLGRILLLCVFVVLCEVVTLGRAYIAFLYTVQSSLSIQNPTSKLVESS